MTALKVSALSEDGLVIEMERSDGQLLAVVFLSVDASENLEVKVTRIEDDPTVNMTVV